VVEELEGGAEEVQLRGGEGGDGVDGCCFVGGYGCCGAGGAGW